MITGTLLHKQVKVLIRNKTAEMFVMVLKSSYLSYLPFLSDSTLVASYMSQVRNDFENNMSCTACLLFSLSLMSVISISIGPIPL